MTKNWDQLEFMQPRVMQILKNSFIKDRIAHAYLFVGPRGTGKQEISTTIAKTIFCEDIQGGYSPCLKCSNCKRIEHGNHPDVHIIKPDGQSLKKGQIEDLQKEFIKTGVESKKKLYMIVHADRMTVSAANSLLKFLEEPNSDTVAILISEQVQRILPTIVSRCQTITFQPLPSKILAENLVSEGVSESMAVLVSKMTNNLEEGLQLSRDEWFAQAQKIVVKLYEVLRRNSLEAMVTLQDEWYSHFKEKEQLDRGLDLLLLIYKDLLYIQINKIDEVVFRGEKDRLSQYALQTSSRRLADQMAAILDAKRKLQGNMNPQLLMEQLVLNLQEGSSFV